MRFGYGLITCQRHPEDLRSDAELYAEALDLAAEAEDLGFDSVWTSEHHFADDSYMPSVLPMSAAIAARTSRVQIATGLALAPLYDPIRLAEDAATVDVISGGRFLLGLGLGWLDWEFEALGTSLAERASAMDRVIRTAREAWGDGLLSDRGVAVTPKPARDGGPPIWIGAHVEPAVRRAARSADGFLAGEPTVEQLELALGWIRDELARTGRDAASLADPAAARPVHEVPMPTVLIVDDEQHIRLLIEQALEELEDDGVEFLTAPDGEVALDVVANQKPQLVFLDVMMPKRNGFDVCRTIKQELGLSGTYVVMLTAKGQAYDRQQGLEAGADEYVTKPFDPDELLATARRALDLDGAAGA